MRRQCAFSHVTKDYLSRFYCILDNMIHGMTSVTLTDSISYNFIIQMIPHHQAAIEMSCSLLKITTCLPLEQIASQIVTTQTKSIENMLAIQDCCRQCVNTSQDLCSYQQKIEQIIQTMFTKMKSAYSSNDVNCNFMREMIPHHQGAIAMSETALQYNICPELVPILQAIITSQKRGVMQMKQLLQLIT